MKKLEIIIESVELNNMRTIIEKIGVSGYTIVKDVAGMGKHGKSVSTSLVDVGEYHLLIIVDNENIINHVVENLKPLFKNYSGVMFLSDVVKIT
ncbi:MAG: hypothetical protein FD143_698 [Ignavibacteria bacterium]|nr:MAG: hypothetical protein FD143_698 [Ignavibacteria bacterium]KAF0161311.1 MAG: hypothetical protein FD188_899 [Ignavibacteria bacterium]